MADYSVHPITTLRQLLDFNAGKLANAELQLISSLERWNQHSISVKFKEVILKCTEYSRLHLQKLSGFFLSEPETPAPPANRVLLAMVEETDEKVDACVEPELKDAALLSAIQEINHYMISAYGTAAAFTSLLELPEISAFFREAEVNEKHIDDRLSQLAEFEINNKARNPVMISS